MKFYYLFLSSIRTLAWRFPRCFRKTCTFAKSSHPAPPCSSGRVGTGHTNTQLGNYKDLQFLNYLLQVDHTAWSKGRDAGSIKEAQKGQMIILSTSIWNSSIPPSFEVHHPNIHLKLILIPPTCLSYLTFPFSPSPSCIYLFCLELQCSPKNLFSYFLQPQVLGKLSLVSVVRMGRELEGKQDIGVFRREG